jgi:tetratricopeptide (TPR) repeat protein
VSWYRLIVSFSIVFLSALQAKALMPISDDELIIRGLLYEEYKAYENSRQVYAKLFDNTEAEIYLFKEATSSLLGRTHITESINRLKAWDVTHPNTLEVKRLLIPLYLTVNELTLAKTEAEGLIERSKKPIDLELASNPFLYSGEFKRALALLSKVYATNNQEFVLLRMADIMDEYTSERKRAIQLLETHRRMNISSNDVLAKLLVLYSKEEDINGLMEIYQALYENTKEEKILTKIVELYAYTRDVDGAIAFLEKYDAANEILYELYKSKKLFVKALKLIDNQYIKSKDPAWLAEKGILLFESAKNKDNKKMIHEVVSLFEKAISLGVDDSIYLNYFGYTLIDKEIDIDRGMQIIEHALVQQPNNTYYLDSLAWGYYKKHECSKAYKYMKRVVDEEGLLEDEIISHWHTIKQCK